MRADARRSAGFTLVEAMVALIIVALGMMAVNSQLNRYAVGTLYIQQKTLASWIASNKITELSVGNEWPAIDDYEEEVDFANQQWHLEIEVSATDVENLHRVDVSVSLAEAPERVIHKVSGLIEPPAPAGFPALQWSLPSGGESG